MWPRLLDRDFAYLVRRVYDYLVSVVIVFGQMLLGTAYRVEVMELEVWRAE